MSESAAVMETQKNYKPGQFRPKTTPVPQEGDDVSPIAKALALAFQSHIDSVAKITPLPAILPGQTPMEPYTDEDGKIRQRPRKACQLDDQGNVIPGSGPFVPDAVAQQLYEMILPHLEHFTMFAVRAMSECLLHPDAKGRIDDRSKIINIPKGRFVFVPGDRPIM